MLVDQTITYIVIISISSLIVLLVAVVILYLRMVKKYIDLKEGKDKEIDPQTLIYQAQEKAQRILEKAEGEARDIVSKAKTFLDLNQNLVAKELEQATKIYAKKYQQILLATQDHILKMLQNIPKDTKDILLAEIASIRAQLGEETQKSMEEAKRLVTEAYQKAEAEVEEYRNERLRNIDESIVMILKEVARKVLAKEISQEEHEKLVLKALEEAKRQGVFGKSESSREQDSQG